VAIELSETIVKALKTSMLAKDKPRTGALRMIRAAFLEAEKSGKELTQDSAHTILRRMAKQRVEAAEVYATAKRQDLADGEKAELMVIEEFLPQLADADTTRAWVTEAVASTGATQMGELGRVMGALMKAHKGQMDGNMARKMVQEALS
jgi:uncharacterized protein YqeY